MDYRAFEKKYVPIQNVLDCYDHLSPCGILDIVQDIAGRHANALNIGFYDLIKKDITWVIARTKIEVLDFPKYATDILVKTWPHRPGRFDCDRDYQIIDEDGKVCVKVTSKWVVINVKTRRMVSPNDVFDRDGIYEEEVNFPSVDGLRFTLDRIDLLHRAKVTMTMLDHNMHMNNSRYGEIIYDALKLKKEEVIKTFEINYHKECHLDDELDVLIKKENKEIFIDIKKEDEMKAKAYITLF